MKTITLAKLYVAKLGPKELDVMADYIRLRRDVLIRREREQCSERNWKLLNKRGGLFVTDKGKVIGISPPGRRGGTIHTIDPITRNTTARAWGWLGTVTLTERLPDHPLRRDLRLSQLKIPYPDR